MIIIKSNSEIALMREAGRVVARVFEKLRKSILPGIKTSKINELAEEELARWGAKSSFNGYHGYPKSICVSINEEVVHGIPGERKLKEGDIVSLDFGALLKGYHGDSALTLPVGEIGEEAERLLKVTKEALNRAISKAQAGNRLGDISFSIQDYVESNGFSVVRDLVGHGIGRSLHEDPQIPNFGKPGQGPLLKVGMTLAIEPMVNMGGFEVEVKEDDWTVITRDRSLSCHFEHTIAILGDGPEILTRV